MFRPASNILLQLYEPGGLFRSKCYALTFLFPFAEERSLNGDFSGWSCNNGIIYSKALAHTCAKNAPICPIICVLPIASASFLPSLISQGSSRELTPTLPFLT